MRDARGHHQHGGGIDRGLSVIGLLVATSGDRHNTRLIVGEIDLVAVFRPRFGSLGHPASRLLSGVFLFGGTVRHLLVVLGLLLRIARCGAGGNLGLGLRHGRQPVFAAFDFFG